MTRSSPKGNLVSGLVLVGIGLLFLVHELYSIPYRFIWPVILIVIGLSVVASYFLERHTPAP